VQKVITELLRKSPGFPREICRNRSQIFAAKKQPISTRTGLFEEINPVETQSHGTEENHYPKIR
jgi:hypothetical protein